MTTPNDPANQEAPSKPSRVAGEDWERRLVGTSFQFRHDFQNHEINPITFHRMRSPFYEGEKWAVRRGSSCLNADGEWEYEPMPSSRDDDFYARCRFPSITTALAMVDSANARASSAGPEGPTSDAGAGSPTAEAGSGS